MMTSSETLSAELISFYRNTRDAQTNHAESKREADLRAQIEQKQNFLQSLKRLVAGMNNLYIGTQAGHEDSVRGREIIRESNAIAQRLIENYNSQQALAMQRRTNWLLSAYGGNSELRAKQKMESMRKVLRVQEQVIAELRSSRRMMEVEKDKQTALTLEREVADIGRDIDRSCQEYRQEEDRICRTLADLGASIGEKLLRRQEMNGIQSDPKLRQQKQQQQHQQLENGGCVDEDFTEAIVNTHDGEDASLRHEGDVSLMLLNESTSKYSFELEFKNPNDFPDLLKIMEPANTSYEKLVKKCQQSVDTAQKRKKKHQSKKQSRNGSQQEPTDETLRKKQKQTVCKVTPPKVAPGEVLAGKNDQENQCPLSGEQIAFPHHNPANRSNRLAKTQASNAGQHQQQQYQRTLRKRKALEPASEVPEAGQIAGKEPKQAGPPAIITADPESIFKEPLPVASFTASGSKRKPKSQTEVPPKAPIKRSTPVEEVITPKRPMKPPSSVAKMDFLSPTRASSSQSAAKGTSNGAKVQEGDILSPENAPSKNTSSNSPPENALETDDHHSMEETQNSNNSSIMMVESTSSSSMDYLLTSPSAEFDLNLSPEQSDTFDNDLDFLNDFDSNQCAAASTAGRKGTGGTRKPNDRNEQAEPDGFDFAFDDGLSSEQLNQREDLF
ncbi:uncharacterized protein LOC126578831 [Anopheles aquasalis]|uniref:uncharacterized protein LOC126578831 n=1 Tax=Anopheles aquasalis TaxID=42839 RepID=UPI00215B10B0|nr:uncharacterized protein LOC126578831 [Anopheles aquasalis]